MPVSAASAIGVALVTRWSPNSFKSGGSASVDM